MDQAQSDHLKGAVEALLFVSEKPVTVDQLKEAISGANAHDLKEVLALIKKDYEAAGRGMTVVEIAGGWQMLSSANCAGYIREFYKTRHKENLSRPSLETLAIIAYKQPVSRMDVEMIRGVNSDGVVMHLLNKGLIKIAGRKEVPGRPYVYGTTVQFLEYFGLRALEDLPKLEEFPALMAKTNDVQPTVNPDAGAAQPLEMPEKTVEAASVDAVQDHRPTPDLSDGEAQGKLEEELARARTRLDIEELERRVEVGPDFLEPGIAGESSGQSRLLGGNAETSGEPDEHPEEKPS
jgi:segregation and condensation protein B